MAVLHTINTLSDYYCALKECLEVLNTNDALVFMDDAAQLDNYIQAELRTDLAHISSRIYVVVNVDINSATATSKATSNTTNITTSTTSETKHSEWLAGEKPTSNPTLISMNDFVDLCCTYPLIHNWY